MAITGEQLKRAFQNSDNVELLEQAIHQGFDINEKDFLGSTILMFASVDGRPQCVKLLLQHNADPNIISFYDCTSLMLASSSNVECLKLLLQAGANIHHKQNGHWTPLMRASLAGRVDCVQCLLEAGIDPLSVDEKGRTSSMIAREKGYLDLADLIDNYNEPIKSALEINEY